MKLSTGIYIQEARDIIFKGVSGARKAWLATAYGVQACRHFYRVTYTRLPDLLEEFKIARHQADGSYTKLMRKLFRMDLLILDEWLLFELTKDEAILLLEIINACYTAKKGSCGQNLRPKLIRRKMMFTYKDRVKAIKLYLKYESYAAVINELGYPSRGVLKTNDPNAIFDLCGFKD